MRQIKTASPLTRARLAAIKYAHYREKQEQRKFVAREGGGKHYVVPLYESGKEGEVFHERYAELGDIIDEEQVMKELNAELYGDKHEDKQY